MINIPTHFLKFHPIRRYSHSFKTDIRINRFGQLNSTLASKIGFGFFGHTLSFDELPYTLFSHCLISVNSSTPHKAQECHIFALPEAWERHYAHHFWQVTVPTLTHTPKELWSTQSWPRSGKGTRKLCRELG